MFSSERLKGIDVFVCVAQYGSFTAAAEKMNLTASAVSKGIARLEKRLDARLFQRTTRTLALTDAGAAFLRTCTGVLADLEDAELSLQAENTEPRGRVRIDLPGPYGRVQVLPILLPWLQAHPLVCRIFPSLTAISTRSRRAWTLHCALVTATPGRTRWSTGC